MIIICVCKYLFKSCFKFVWIKNIVEEFLVINDIGYIRFVDKCWIIIKLNNNGKFDKVLSVYDFVLIFVDIVCVCIFLKCILMFLWKINRVIWNNIFIL